MPKEKREVESALLRKGFSKDDNKHHKFYYKTIKGNITRIFTQTSYGARSKSLGDPLLHQMARQCQLTNKEFSDFVDCAIDQTDYEKLLLEKGLL